MCTDGQSLTGIDTIERKRKRKILKKFLANARKRRTVQEGRFQWKLFTVRKCGHHWKRFKVQAFKCPRTINKHIRTYPKAINCLFTTDWPALERGKALKEALFQKRSADRFQWKYYSFQPIKIIVDRTDHCRESLWGFLSTDFFSSTVGRSSGPLSREASKACKFTLEFLDTLNALSVAESSFRLDLFKFFD